ncbi:recombination regulator RecX [Polynucleobacter kasalickyi]|uniref:Regulatory protein RecX n=1 Tax=Polynucleobacter kasalickyi TaxID=1938817 RepID=A0A1W1YK77_9BURK|nr:recombination regulator RecX [Polynucleobacter kasalickyi]SMC36536.1 regulatory protein [Polynucleobacter kasalickyi]
MLSDENARPKISLIGRAIKYLSNREYSQFELRKKLLPYASSEEELDAVIAKLLDKGYLSNERFTQSFISSKSSKFGIRKLTHVLQQHQLAPEMLKVELGKLKESEFQRCYEVWEKKFGMLTNEPNELAKQIRFLASRGFPQEVIMGIVRGKHPN